MIAAGPTIDAVMFFFRTARNGEFSMEKNEVSLGALAAAYYRAYHAENDTPTIFCDYLSSHLIKEEERLRLEVLFAELFESIDSEGAASPTDQPTALARTMRSIPFPSIALCRSRYAEDSLETALKRGVRQYVNLGAGMDTFAFRRTELMESLQVFEVDQPGTQEAKRRRIAELGWERPERLHLYRLISQERVCRRRWRARPMIQKRSPSSVGWG